MHHYEYETIIARATPVGAGALALIRLSGPSVLSIVNSAAHLASGIPLIQQPSHTIHYGHIIDENHKVVDNVLFMIMKAPRTFTGEDTVEISCHNNELIIQTIIHVLLSKGARLARQGEFTKRAVLNGKIDLIQAEAIHEVIVANTGHAITKSLAQLEGSLSSLLHQIEQQLIQALAYSEASFEFIEEENMTFGSQIFSLVRTANNAIATILRSTSIQQQVRQGIRIALIGPANAGKSSLFNALLGQSKAIVTDIAGTTRDALEGGLYKEGRHITLIDTAGLRDTVDVIEKMGIQKSYEQAQAADIILIVQEDRKEQSRESFFETFYQEHKNNIIQVCTKYDLDPDKDHSDHGCIAVSSITGANMPLLEEAIKQKIAMLFDSYTTSYLINERQHGLLVGLQGKLENLIELLDKAELEYEIISCHLHDALTLISELTGKAISEEAMDAVFRTFCVGK